MAGSSTDFIYKLVDSTQLDADLTTVANAIRTKGGTSAQLSFPSGMAQAIAAIPSGGSLPSVISKIDGGSFTPASDMTSNAQITHDLGVVPVGVIVWTEDTVTASGSYISLGALCKSPTLATIGRIFIYGNNTYDSYNMTSYAESCLTATFFSLFHGLKNYEAGKTYKWLAWA